MHQLLRTALLIVSLYLLLSHLLLLLALVQNFFNDPPSFTALSPRLYACSEDHPHRHHRRSQADYIKICKANESNLPRCIRSSVEQLRHRLKSGIPELDVPPMEPFLLEKFELKRGPSNARVDANITDLKVWGPSDFQVEDLKVDLRTNKFWFKVKLPRLRIEGTYELDMSILFVQLKGRGPITGNFSNYEAQALMKGKVIVEDGREYLKFDRMRMRIGLGESKLHLGNLFSNGNERNNNFGSIANDLINENPDLFLNEIRPSLENSLAEKFTEIANKITLKFTYQELFPSS